MSISITENEVQRIVMEVLKNVEGNLAELSKKVDNQNSGVGAEISASVPAGIETDISKVTYNGQASGVFDNVEEAIDAAYNAQIVYANKYRVEDRERIIAAIRQATLDKKEVLAHMVYEETKLGRYEDKVAKHELTALKTPGTEDLKTIACSGDAGLTIIERGPFGLIGAVTPVTNPTESIINNTIGMIASGNAVVFNVHPSAKNSCAYAVSMLNKTIVEAGGPENLVTMVRIPTMETLNRIIESPKVRLLVGTGGPGLVKTLLKSGKKAIGAGAGNPPVIVDDTADIEHAAKEIIKGASFDNNILCIAEKEVFALEKIADDLIFYMLQNGAYMLDKKQLEQVMEFALEANIKQEARGCSLDNKREYHVAKQWVGKDASMFLEKIGVTPPSGVRLLICEVDFDHPFVQLEQMMPVLPIVRVKDLEKAIEYAVKAEHGNRHTAVMHSRNVDNLTKFARAIGTTIFVKNASSMAGVGFGGEGHTTMTIAGPTGEGLTSASTFTRIRRCVLAEGGFRII